MSYRQYVENCPDDYYWKRAPVKPERNLPPVKPRGRRVSQLPRTNDAHILARKAGLTAGSEALQEQAERDYDASGFEDWFGTEGLFSATGHHPLEAPSEQKLAEEDLKAEQYRQRRSELMRSVMSTRMSARSLLQEIRHPEAHELGFYRWKYKEEAKSSVEFATAQLKTPRQVAGALSAMYPDAAISVVHNANMRTAHGITPVYTAFLSPKESNIFLLKENNYAKALREIDVEHLEDLSKRIKICERNLAKVSERTAFEAATNLDDQQIRRWVDMELRKKHKLAEMRERYSADVAKASIEAETSPEPCNLHVVNTKLHQDSPAEPENITVNDDHDGEQGVAELICEAQVTELVYNPKTETMEEVPVLDENGYFVTCDTVIVADQEKVGTGATFQCPCCGADVSINQNDMMIQRLLNPCKTGYSKSNKVHIL